MPYFPPTWDVQIRLNSFYFSNCLLIFFIGFSLFCSGSCSAAMVDVTTSALRCCVSQCVTNSVLVLSLVRAEVLSSVSASYDCLMCSNESKTSGTAAGRTPTQYFLCTMYLPHKLIILSRPTIRLDLGRRGKDSSGGKKAPSRESTQPDLHVVLVVH